MRNSVKALLIGGIAVLAIATGVLFTQYQRTNSELTVARTGQEDAEAKYAKTIDDIAEIQDSLNAISLGDTNVARMPWNAETGQRLSRVDEQQALDRIALLRASISRSKERINNLEANLEKSGTQIAGLRKIVTNLRHDVADKEAMVTALSQRVDELQGQVTTLTTTVEDKRQELATIYYIVGDKKALKTAGVVESKGGVLGIGKTLRPSPTADVTAFTPMDTDEQTVIPIPAEKAQLISAQPAGSYELVASADGTMELRILDPAAFRKIREVVILTS